MTGIMALSSLVIAFIVFSFGEPCACYTPTMELAMYIGIPYTLEPTLKEVQIAFARKFPSGQHPSENNLLRFEEEKDFYSINKRKNAWVCTYWLKASYLARKGYQITIDLDSSGNIRRTHAVYLESWFGIKIESDNGPA
jgi:hypothetical protein